MVNKKSNELSKKLSSLMDKNQYHSQYQNPLRKQSNATGDGVWGLIQKKSVKIPHPSRNLLEFPLRKQQQQVVTQQNQKKKTKSKNVLNGNIKSIQLNHKPSLLNRYKSTYDKFDQKSQTQNENENFLNIIRSSIEDGFKNAVETYLASQFKNLNDEVINLSNKIKKLTTNYELLSTEFNNKIISYGEEHAKKLSQIKMKIDLCYQNMNLDSITLEKSDRHSCRNLHKKNSNNKLMCSSRDYNKKYQLNDNKRLKKSNSRSSAFKRNSNNQSIIDSNGSSSDSNEIRRSQLLKSSARSSAIGFEKQQIDNIIRKILQELKEKKGNLKCLQKTSTFTKLNNNNNSNNNNNNNSVQSSTTTSVENLCLQLHNSPESSDKEIKVF